MVPSKSTICSPLVVAPKGEDDIRLCADYRIVNESVEMEGFPTVVVQQELHKAVSFALFIDTDMTAGFHQIPIDEESSNKLSIVTDRELLRPRFLPEGVRSATAYLNEATTNIFREYLSFMMVIHDNITVMGHDFPDLIQKWKLVLNKCKEFNVILKLKKTWIGFRQIDWDLESLR